MRQKLTWGLSASTSQNNLSILRTFAEWIGNAGMVRGIEHYYQVMRSCGITRNEGITSHGLRHQYAQERYRELAGVDSPVRSGAQIDRESDHAARQVVAEELGHSREGITTHYLGR
jgi:integrase